MFAKFIKRTNILSRSFASRPTPRIAQSLINTASNTPDLHNLPTIKLREAE
jgi:3'-phosphoadenosine 5'-phosphosulfate synthase